MEGDESEWWMIDREQCWRDLFDLWTEWELRNMLMHNNWTWERTKVEDEEMGVGLGAKGEPTGGLNWGSNWV